MGQGGAMDPGNLLRALRRARQLSQRELADEANLPRSTIDRIESGQTSRPSLWVIERIVESVGYSLVVADYHDRLLMLDDANGRLRDRGWRHYPAHLPLRPIRNMDDRWWGWHRIAFNDEDPHKPDWAYRHRRRHPVWTDDPWADAT